MGYQYAWQNRSSAALRSGPSPPAASTTDHCVVQNRADPAGHPPDESVIALVVTDMRGECGSEGGDWRRQKGLKGPPENFSQKTRKPSPEENEKPL